MYFPHAFQKVFVGTAGFLQDSSKFTYDLTGGQIGVIDSKTHKVVDLTPVTPYEYKDLPMFYIAQGSFHTSDKLGPFHGGYKESVKSKGINPKYVSKFYVTEPAIASNQILNINVGTNCTTLNCGTTYRLHVDIKGSPALRTMTRNLYHTADAYTGCCDASGSNVDPNIVLLQWKDQINGHPILKDFVLAKVWNLNEAALAIDPTSGSDTVVIANADKTKIAVGDKVVAAGIPLNTFVKTIGADDTGGTGNSNVTLTNKATASDNVNAKVYGEIASDTYTAETGADADTNDCHMDLIGAYTDSTFSDCSFERTDNVDYAPVEIYASVVDDLENVCEVMCFSISETQASYQGKGYGDTLLKELILSKSYEQESFHDNDTRLREILGENYLTQISRNSKYITYNILHSVPRKSNPSSTMDADQYHVKIVVNARDTDFESFMNAMLITAGNSVQLEELA